MAKFSKIVSFPIHCVDMWVSVVGTIVGRADLQPEDSLVLSAGGIGCTRKPERTIVSMAEAPEYQHPGKALTYASTWTEGQVPYGIMIKTLDGRPVKIEGLPDHPLARGASTSAMQN